MIHSFLLIGQSNMAGSGDAGEVKPIFSSRISMFGRRYAQGWEKCKSRLGLELEESRNLF